MNFNSRENIYPYLKSHKPLKESSSLTVECHQSCALMKSLSANSSRRNSDSSDPVTFQELLQERRKLLTKYVPQNDSHPKEETESKTPEWMLTRASIIHKDDPKPYSITQRCEMADFCLAEVH